MSVKHYSWKARTASEENLLKRNLISKFLCSVVAHTSPHRQNLLLFYLLLNSSLVQGTVLDTVMNIKLSRNCEVFGERKKKEMW